MFFAVLGIEPRTLTVLGKCSAAKRCFSSKEELLTGEAKVLITKWKLFYRMSFPEAPSY